MADPVRLGPSLVAAPLTHLEQTIRELEAAQVDFLHVDLEDGHFVPAMGLGTRLLEEVCPLTELPLDVHLSVTDPERMIALVAGMGADTIAVHWEACPYPRRTLGMIHELGKPAGMVFNARTPLPDLRYLLPRLDFVNVQSTEPEFPESPFLPETLDKVRALRALAGELKPELGICVDGGLNPGNLAAAVESGAGILVVGRSVFGEGTIAENVAHLRAAIAA